MPDPSPADRAARRLPDLVLAVVAGAVAGVLGSCAQQVVAGPARLPVGLLLAVGLLASVAVLVTAALTSPWAGAGLAVGWFAVVVLAGTRRREGDLLVPADARGYGFLLAGAAVLAVAVAVSLRRSAVAS